MNILNRFIKFKTQLKHLDYSAYVVDNSITADKFPKAVGWLRDFQEANLKILKEVDRICRENNLRYWLAYGTLLGAIRHHGSIPWDDDIDIVMIREDYNQFIKLFPKVSDTKFRIKTYFEKEWNFTKVHVDFTHLLFVDIFPADYHFSTAPSLHEKLNVTADIVSARTELIRQHAESIRTDNERRDLLDKLYSQFVLKGNSVDPRSRPAINTSIDYVANSKVQCFDYEDIFPLSEIKYEDALFYAPNRPDRVLTYMYGDYMKLPREITPHHSEFNNVQLEDILKIKDFLGRK